MNLISNDYGSVPVTSLNPGTRLPEEPKTLAPSDSDTMYMSVSRTIVPASSMPKKRFTGHQIIKVFKRVEGGRAAAEACREYSVSQAAYYNWKSKHSGMEASESQMIQ